MPSEQALLIGRRQSGTQPTVPHDASRRTIGYRPFRLRRREARSALRETVRVLSEGRRLAQSEDPRDSDRIRVDEVTMAAVAAGDEGAFALLVGEHTPRLLRLSRSVLSDSPAEADEVVQEALLRLWRQAGDWRADGRVSTWLQKVTYRLSIDRLRRRRPAVPIDAVEDELEDTAPRADVRLIRIEDARLVGAAVDSLPERQKHAIMLCHFQGLSQAEAAAVMEIGEAAYESLLARARRSLRAMLAGNNRKGGGDE